MRCKRLLSLTLAAVMLFGSAAALPDGMFDDGAGIIASATEIIASGYCGPSANWTLDDKGQLIISGNGIIGNSYKSPFENIANEITSVKITEGIDTIGKFTFSLCSCIEKVTIPESVSKIDMYAFSQCFNLKTIVLPKKLKRIERGVFDASGLTSIDLPDSLTYIGDWAFGRCLNLKQISIPNSVVQIDDYAFSGCSKMERIILPENIKTIGNYVFQFCRSLSEITIPKGVTSIGNNSFHYCERLSNISIPTSVNTIKSNAFNMCTGLKSIIIPASVTTIGEHALGFNGDNKGNDFIIHCYNSSTAQEYAVENGITYNILECEHSFSDWLIVNDSTCVEAGDKERLCSECGKTETQSIAPLGHDYKATVVAPTCTAKGYTLHKCTRCGDSYKDTYKDAATHSWSAWTTTKKSTCTAAGSKKRTCTICGQVETASIAKLGHDYKTTVVKPTCTAEGYTIHKCSRCGKQYTDTKTDIIEHEPDEAVSENVKPATCLEEGSYDEVIYCKGCHKELNRTKKVIEKIDHSIDDWRSISYNLKKNTITQSGKCTVCGATITRTVENAVTRLSGNNRFGTAAEIAKAAYPTAETVILAYGLNYADALAGVPLAEKLNAPILLTHIKTLPDETLAEIKRLGAKNVIILGGEGAISKDVEKTLKKQGLKTRRLAGKTRFETATTIAEKLNDAPTDVFFVYAFNSADALSVSTAAALKDAPIIYLSTKGDLNADTAAYLAKLREKGCVKNAYVIGGDGVISDAMMKKVANALGLKVNKTVQRVAGKNRYETCVEVNTKFADLLTGDGICVAKGLDFPDALAGGVYAAATKQALFLADGKKLQDCQNTYLKGKNAGKITVFGGTGAVPDELVKLIAQASV